MNVEIYHSNQDKNGGILFFLLPLLLALVNFHFSKPQVRALMHTCVCTFLSLLFVLSSSFHFLFHPVEGLLQISPDSLLRSFFPRLQTLYLPHLEAIYILLISLDVNRSLLLPTFSLSLPKPQASSSSPSSTPRLLLPFQSVAFANPSYLLRVPPTGPRRDPCTNRLISPPFSECLSAAFLATVCILFIREQGQT